MLGDIWVYKKTSRIYVTLLLLAVIMLATQNWQLGVLLFIIVAGCIVYTKRCDLTQEKKLMKYLDDLSAGVSAGTVYAVKNLPVGIAMMDSGKDLVWTNPGPDHRSENFENMGQDRMVRLPCQWHVLPRFP